MVNSNLITCALSVVLFNYNCAITSYALHIRDPSDATGWASLWEISSIVVGLLLGQIFFGLFKDLLGERNGLMYSSVLVVTGTVLAILPDISDWLLGASRVIVGIGTAGTLPVLAELTCESSQTHLMSKLLAQLFGPIGSLGLIIAPLVALGAFNLHDVTDEMAWRLVVVCGALPAIAITVLSFEDYWSATSSIETGVFKQSITSWRDAIIVFEADINVIRQSHTLRMNFVGVVSAWFFSDYVFYGNLILQLRLIEQILASSYAGDDDYLLSLSNDGFFLIGVTCAAVFWFGGVVSVSALRKVSVLAVQLQGFTLSAVAFFTITVLKTHSTSNFSIASIGVYVFLYFSLGVGATPSIVLLPSLVFPRNIRHTVHTIANIAGKVGALVALLVAGSTSVHLCIRMSLFGAACVCGAASTLILIQAHMQTSTTEPYCDHEVKTLAIGTSGSSGSPANGHRSRYPSLSPSSQTSLGTHRTPTNMRSELSAWLRGNETAESGYTVYGAEEEVALISSDSDIE